jgi:DNA polymerase III epsilon subunit-like protein
MGTVSNIPEQFQRADTNHLTDLNMSTFEGIQFNAVYDALTLAINGLRGISNQPRCQLNRGLLNPAGEYIDSLVEFFHAERVRLLETLHHTKVEGDYNKRLRMNLLVQHEAECAELEPAELAAFVLSFSSTH